MKKNSHFYSFLVLSFLWGQLSSCKSTSTTENSSSLEAKNDSVISPQINPNATAPSSLVLASNTVNSKKTSTAATSPGSPVQNAQFLPKPIEVDGYRCNNSDFATAGVSKSNFTFCYKIPNATNNKKPYHVTLFFHGLAEHILPMHFKKFDDALKNMSATQAGTEKIIPMFVSYGQEWFLSRDPKKFSVQKMITQDLFFAFEYMKHHEQIELESKFSLIGKSMGGHNVVQFTLNAPQLLKAVVSTCAGLTDIPPFIPWYQTLEKKKKLEKFTKAPYFMTEKNVKFVQEVQQKSFSDNDAWEKSNYKKLAPLFPSSNIPRWWIDYEITDELGVAFPTQSLVMMLKPKYSNTTLNVTEHQGMHCTYYYGNFETLYGWLVQQALAP